MMKLAIPTRNNRVEDHFGRCEYYTIFKLDNNEIVKTEIIHSEYGCGCQSDIASVLSGHGVTVMLAGNMGHGALRILNEHGITVLRGCSGNARKLAEAYLAGEIEDSGEDCLQYSNHHGHHHDHGHHHGHGSHNCQH